MPTITETITDKLLNAIGDSSELDKVIHERSNSKGPFYIALAQATALMTEKLKDISGKYQAMEKGHHELQEGVRKAEQTKEELDEKIATRNKEIASLDEKLKEKQGLLDQAKMLGGLGFGPDELGKLYQILAQAAASQEAKQEEAISIFFREVDRYEKLISLELEAKRLKFAVDKAQAEAERWQAQSQAAEAKCKARKSSIDVMEKLLAQGIKEGDIPQWMNIIAKAGVTFESLADSLEKFSSIQKLAQDRLARVEKFDEQIIQLTAQVKALTAERESVIAAITAIREKALSEIDLTSKGVQHNLQVLSNRAKEKVETECLALTTKTKVLNEEIAQFIPVTKDAVSQLTKELYNEVEEAIAGVGKLRSHSLEVGKEVGRYEAILELNVWIKELLNLVRGEHEIEAKQVRVIALTVMRGVDVWLRTQSRSSFVVNPLAMATDNLVKELEEWKV